MRAIVHQNTTNKQSNSTNSAAWNKPEVDLEQEHKEALHLGKPFPKGSNGGSGDDKPNPSTLFAFDFSKIPISPPPQTRIQPKLKINARGDKYEQEADRVAEQVVRMPNPMVQHKPKWSPPDLFPNLFAIQRKCDACSKEEEEKKLQRKENDTSNIKTNNSLESYVSGLNNSGQPLSKEVRSIFEPRLGYDFGKVRIHTDDAAAASAQSINAHAYTIGNNIVFNQGQFEPATTTGRKLLGHELTHVIQQRQAVIQRQDGDGTGDDKEKELGDKIMASSPDGLKIGVYDHNEAEMVRQSGAWAINENAIGFKGIKNPVKLDHLFYGLAISDENKIGPLINQMSVIAKSAVEKAAKAKGVTPGNEHKIKALAFFAHGTEGWCSISPISGSAGKKLVKDVGSVLKDDIDFIIYACSVANSPDEKHDDWDKGTHDAGGKGSLAAGVRDELYDQGIRSGKVWGHTTVGHVTTNFALRYFSSSSKDTLGQSYLSNYVFTPYDEYLVRQEVYKELKAQNYDTSVIEEQELITYQFKNLRSHFYKCYAEANSKEKYNGRNLAEAAPNHPTEVAKIVNDYWKSTYWGKIKDNYLKAIIKKFKLRRTDETK